MTSYSLVQTVFEVERDRSKTKLNYNMGTDNLMVDESFKEYSDLVNLYIKTFEMEELETPDQLVYEAVIASSSPQKDKKKEKYFYNFFLNGLLGLLNLITIFMFLWYVRDLKIKENLVRTIRILIS